MKSWRAAAEAAGQCAAVVFGVVDPSDEPSAAYRRRCLGIGTSGPDWTSRLLQRGALLARANEPAAEPAAAAAKMGPNTRRFIGTRGPLPRRRPGRRSRTAGTHRRPPCGKAWKGHLIKPATALNKTQPPRKDDASDKSESTKHEGKGRVGTTTGYQQNPQHHDRARAAPSRCPGQADADCAADAS